MLNMEEAQQLMETFIELRSIAKETKDFKAFKKHERECIEKFSYIINIKASKYKAYANYEDLKQEGYMALMNAMKNYDPKKGNAFWWFTKYISTRIARSASLHTAIRFPLKFTKTTSPHKEAIMPLLIEETYQPDKQLEKIDSYNTLAESINKLDDVQRQVITLFYGLDNDKLSINKICKKLKITRTNCLKTIDNTLLLMKENIKD